jgi:hypothetical protein
VSQSSPEAFDPHVVGVGERLEVTVPGRVVRRRGALLVAGACAAAESLPLPARTRRSGLNIIRIVILAEVARTDDRNLLQQRVNDARDAYSTGSSVVRRGTAHVLALTAWQRDDVHDAMRWLGGITLFESPLWPEVLDQVILGARVAAAAGDAGLRARVLQATDLLPTAPCPATQRGGPPRPSTGLPLDSKW